MPAMLAGQRCFAAAVANTEVVAAEETVAVGGAGRIVLVASEVGG